LPLTPVIYTLSYTTLFRSSQASNPAAISQATPSRIPVRSLSLAIVVTVVLYVGMATLADWEAFGAAVSALPGLLWVQVVVLSLLDRKSTRLNSSHVKISYA